MECTIDWLAANGMAFSAETGSGHLLTMDGAPDGGGRNLAPRPMETVLDGTGACAAYDVVLILKRGRHDVHSCRVKVSSERAAQDPGEEAVGQQPGGGRVHGLDLSRFGCGKNRERRNQSFTASR